MVLVVEVPGHPVASLRHHHAGQAVVGYGGDRPGRNGRGDEPARRVVSGTGHAVLRRVGKHVAARAAGRESLLCHRPTGPVVPGLVVCSVNVLRLPTELAGLAELSTLSTTCDFALVLQAS